MPPLPCPHQAHSDIMALLSLPPAGGGTKGLVWWAGGMPCLPGRRTSHQEEEEEEEEVCLNSSGIFPRLPRVSPQDAVKPQDIISSVNMGGRDKLGSSSAILKNPLPVSHAAVPGAVQCRAGPRRGMGRGSALQIRKTVAAARLRHHGKFHSARRRAGPRSTGWPRALPLPHHATQQQHGQPSRGAAAAAATAPSRYQPGGSSQPPSHSFFCYPSLVTRGG
ncbi:hypothetical protein E2C01_074529 [Portunus trituberculatus]|uniref:Uncharacterized protein n=1 Tax=Portunus trituberculatus TaxID=210409 RepID=A0A5B7I5W1_PORTR|nr:hypothetical protein [Portunus trituberculatus]